MEAENLGVARVRTPRRNNAKHLSKRIETPQLMKLPAPKMIVTMQNTSVRGLKQKGDQREGIPAKVTMQNTSVRGLKCLP
ncbi:hypothetical protein [Kroppenstedtia eburnea]